MGLSSSRGSSLNSRIMIFIDGNYLEKHISAKVDEEINYSTLGNYLRQQCNYGSLVRCYFYDGLPDPEQNLSYLEGSEQTKRTDELNFQYQKKKEHFDKIAMFDYFQVRKGKAVYNKGFDKQGKERWEFRQKGVDSLIAIDMLTKAYQGHYDVGILVAGDSDFIEIVKSVKDTGVNIMGAYFQDRMPKELVYEFDRKFVLRIEELKLNHVLTKK